MTRSIIPALLVACLMGGCGRDARNHPDDGRQLAARWHKDPGAARQWLLEHTGNDAQRFMQAILASGHYDSWVEKTPAQLALAILDFPAGERPVRLQGIFEKWVAADADDAGNFIDEHLMPGPARDAAVIALVEGIRDERLAEAVAWARTISERGQMYSLLESLATH
ncbi:MAG: hypothetical protein VYB61_03515 [Verrucomicrobiota bacterium]|nr:hypothetical protein [Verrucomicrobiota bacterium]